MCPHFDKNLSRSNTTLFFLSYHDVYSLLRLDKVKQGHTERRHTSDSYQHLRLFPQEELPQVDPPFL